LLEELLLDYQGTLLLVSHDRDFLDHVVTSCLVFTGDCRVEEFVGGYSDWEARRKQRRETPRQAPSSSRVKPAPAPPKQQQGRLGYKDQRELDALPQRIESLEAQLEQLQHRLSDPALYQSGGEGIGELQQSLRDLEQELEAAYTRWERLEALRDKG
jgi:ATP-binding cassette subfamily F protein uup